MLHFQRQLRVAVFVPHFDPERSKCTAKTHFITICGTTDYENLCDRTRNTKERGCVVFKV